MTTLDDPDAPQRLSPWCPYCDEEMPGRDAPEREEALSHHIDRCPRVRRLRTMSPLEDAPVYGERPR